MFNSGSGCIQYSIFNIQYSIFNIEYVSVRDITLYKLIYRHTHLMNKSIGEFLVNSPKDL